MMERELAPEKTPAKSSHFAKECEEALLRFANVAFYLAAKTQATDAALADEFRQRAYALYALMLDDTMSHSATGLESALHQLRVFTSLIGPLRNDPQSQEDYLLASEILDHFAKLISARRQALFCFDR